MKKYGKFEFDENSKLYEFDQLLSLYIYYLDDANDEDPSLKEHSEAVLKKAQTDLLKLKTELTDDVVCDFLEEKKKLCLELQQNPDIKLVKETGYLSDFDLGAFNDRISKIATRDIRSINATQEFFENTKAKGKS